MQKLFFPIIFAAARENRESLTKKITSIVEKEIRQAGFETTIIDARDTYEICHANRELDFPQAKELREIFSRADGFVIVSPEYNHGYPGDLKNVLDSFYEEYNRKPVGIIGVSNGGIGGARMVEQLRLVAIALQMVPLNAVVHFSKAQNLFDEKGVFTGQKAYHTRFEKFFEELSWYASALKSAREK